MKIIIKRPGKFPEEKTIRDDENEALNDLQEIVGGYVQMVHAFDRSIPLVLIVDEDGKLKDGYKPNIVLPNEIGKIVDYCVGTVAVVGLVRNKEKELVFGSVDKRLVGWVKDWLDVRQIEGESK